MQCHEPGVTRPGAVTSYPWSTFDLFPTLLGQAGVAAPEGIDSMDLSPVWKGESAALRDSLFTSYGKVQRSVRDLRWKLIRYHQFDEWELFDLEADPHELTNLYGTPGMEERTRDLKRRLMQLRVQYGDDSDVSVQPAAWRKRFEVRR